ncbi:hypothetical protein D8676_26250 [Mesorhizobium sp. YM1C-6-2]|nr:hypothetical protein D8676_26250 [Mesorhizobium sp. YM1C-6-2]
MAKLGDSGQAERSLGLHAGRPMRTPTQDKLAPPVGKYVVYDPPADGLPYVAVLFLPEQRPKVFFFDNAEDAETFLTSHAIERLQPRR